MQLTGLLGLNIQPETPAYRHPLALIYSAMFPSLVRQRNPTDDYYTSYRRFEIGPAGSIVTDDDYADSDASQDYY